MEYRLTSSLPWQLEICTLGLDSSSSRRCTVPMMAADRTLQWYGGRVNRRSERVHHWLRYLLYTRCLHNTGTFVRSERAPWWCAMELSRTSAATCSFNLEYCSQTPQACTRVHLHLPSPGDRFCNVHEKPIASHAFCILPVWLCQNLRDWRRQRRGTVSLLELQEGVRQRIRAQPPLYRRHTHVQ